MKETVDAINTFKEEYNKVKENPAQKNERFTHYCSFLAHVRPPILLNKITISFKFGHLAVQQGHLEALKGIL